MNRGMKVLQTFALPLGYVTMVKKRRLWRKRLFYFWSGRRGSNSLPPPWQGGALPDELRPQIILSVLDGFYIICIFPRFVKLKIRKISKASRASFFIHPSLWPKINGILFFFCFLGLSSLSSNSRENILINSPFEFNCLKVRKDSSKP